MNNGACATKVGAADFILTAGTDFPTGATVVYLHWVLLTPDGTNPCTVEIENPAGTITATVRASGTQSVMANFSPAIRYRVRSSGEAIRFDTALAAGTLSLAVGYTWN